MLQEEALAANQDDQPMFQHLVGNRVDNNNAEEEDNSGQDEKEESTEATKQQQQNEEENTAEQEHTPIQIRLPLQLDFDELAGVSKHVRGLIII